MVARKTNLPEAELITVETNKRESTKASNIDDRLDAWVEYIDDDEVICKAYRMNENGPQKGKHQLLFHFSPIDFTANEIEQKCMNEYGGGTYYVKGYRENKLLFNKNFTIASPINQDARPMVSGGGFQNGNEMMMFLFEQQRQAQDRQAEMMMAMMNAFAGKSTADPVDTYLKLRELEPKRESDVELLLKGMELAREKNDDDEEGTVKSLIKEFLPPLSHIVKAEAERSNRNPPVIQNTPVSEDPTQADIQAKAMEIFKENVNRLVTMASIDMDVESALDMILFTVPSEEIYKIHAFVSQDTWYENLCQVEPRAADYPEWFTLLVEGFKDRLSDEEEENPTDEEKGEN